MARSMDLPVFRPKEKESVKKLAETTPNGKIDRKLLTLGTKMERVKLAQAVKLVWGRKISEKPKSLKDTMTVSGISAKKWTPEADFLSQLGAVPEKKVTQADIAHAETLFQNKYGKNGFTLEPVLWADGENLPKLFLNGEPLNGILRDKNGKPRMTYIGGKAEIIK